MVSDSCCIFMLLNYIAITNNNRYDHREQSYRNRVSMFHERLTHSLLYSKFVELTLILGIKVMVTKDIPDNAVVGGIPAHIIKFKV